MALPQEHFYTIEDIDALPEGMHAELIDGQIYNMSPPPNRIHQQLSAELLTEIKNRIKRNNGHCKAYAAPFAVFLNADDTVYLEPDISIICDTNKLDERGCKGAPDWIIEIVSSGNPSHDYVKKLHLYESAGVREYWIVDPRNDTVQVFFFESIQFPVAYTFRDTIQVNIYKDECFEIDFAKLDI